MIRQIAHQGHIFKFPNSIDRQILEFRHDRVRDWLASAAIAQELLSGKLSDEILTEPYYSRIIGLSLNHNDITPNIIKIVKSYNPLALFYALQEFSMAKTETQKAIITAIEEWLGEKDTHSGSNEYLRWECIRLLAQTDSPHVLKILNFFNDRPRFYYGAGFRNGNFSFGLILCCITRPGENDTTHEQLIQHVISNNRQQVIDSIISLFTRDDLDLNNRAGLLRLCGYTEDSKLSSNLQKAWDRETKSDQRKLLADYLWACAHCCGKEPSLLLNPIFDIWASLADRERVFDPLIRWAFQKYPPVNAIEYFITQASRSELCESITLMLNGIDHPQVIDYIANYYVIIERKIEESKIDILTAESNLNRLRSDYDKPMSEASKTQLYGIWSNQKLDRHLRTQSFYLWSQYHAKNDIEVMKTFETDEVLGKSILIQRILRGDIDVLPRYIDELTAESDLIQGIIQGDVKDLACQIKKLTNFSWWQYAEYIWSDKLTTLLEEKLNWLSSSVSESKEWDNYFYPSEQIFYKLIMGLPNKIAESILVKNWEYMKFSSAFIQTALFIATDHLVELVAEAVDQCPAPKKLFEFLSFKFGIGIDNHPQVKSIKQLEVLIPYLDLLEELDINALSRFCNDRGWYGFRKKYFDSRLLSVKGVTPDYLCKEGIIQTMDKLAEGNMAYQTSGCIDSFLWAGWSIEDLIDIVFQWVKQKNTITLEVLKVSFEVILHIGTREHYFKLLNICFAVKDKFFEYLENALFLLKVKRLH